MISEQEAKNSIKKVLVNNLLRDLNGINELAVPFSGGIDSVLLTKLAKDYTEAMNIHLYVVGFKGCYDIKSAKKAAKWLDLPLKVIYLNDYYLKEESKNLSKLLNSRNLVTISFCLPLYLVCQNAKEKHLLSGQGADTLFGGFYKFQKVSGDELRNLMNKMLREFLINIPNREEKIAKQFNKIILLQYSYKNLVNYVKKLPSEYKINGKQMKYILREVAKDIGIPEIYANKPKKASQYGSGIMKRLKKREFSRHTNM